LKTVLARWVVCSHCVVVLIDLRSCSWFSIRKRQRTCVLYFVTRCTCLYATRCIYPYLHILRLDYDDDYRYTASIQPATVYNCVVGMMWKRIMISLLNKRSGGFPPPLKIWLLILWSLNIPINLYVCLCPHAMGVIRGRLKEARTNFGRSSDERSTFGSLGNT